MATLTQQAELEALERRLAELEAMRKELEPAKEDAPVKQAQAVLPSSGYFPAMAGARGVSLSPEGMGAIRDAAIEGAGATSGQMIGAIPALSVPTMGASIPIGGAIGGFAGNLAAQKARGEPSTRWGEALGAAASGLIPGPSGAFGRAGAKKVLSEAGKQAIGNLGASAVASGVDEGRAPSLSEAAVASAAGLVGAGLARGASSGVDSAAERAAKMEALRYSDRDFTIRLANQAGFVFDPVKLNPNVVTKGVDRLAVESAFHKAAIDKNQAVTNQLVRAELGLAEGDSLNHITLDTRALELRQPYEAIRAMGKDGADAVQELIEVRKKARDAWSDYQKNRTRDAVAEARAMDERAEALEDRIEKMAAKAGVPQAVDDLRASRKALAKVYVVQNALNDAANEVDASIIGKMYDKNPKMLDGNLKLVGQVANIQPYMFRAASAQKASSSTSGRIMGLGMGAGMGYAAGQSAGGLTGGIVGAMMGGGIGAGLGGIAADAASVPFKNLATSPGYQRAMAMPRYNMRTPEAVSTYLLNASKAAGR